MDFFQNKTVKSTENDLINYAEFLLSSEATFSLCTLLCLLGVACNLMTIRLFVCMGLRDGVTLAFLALSLSDLGFTLSMLVAGVTSLMSLAEMGSKYYVYFSVDPYSLAVFLANISVIFYINTELLTSFLALGRCVCVARPLHFKTIFTKKLALSFGAGSALFAVAIYLPILTNMSMVHEFDQVAKVNRTKVWFSPLREVIKDAVYVVTDLFLAWASQFIVVVCVFVLTNCLRKASKFRRSCMIREKSLYSSEKTRNEENVIISSEHNSQNVAELDARQHLSQRKHVPHNYYGQLSVKDLQVLQQVTIISLMYVITNCPKVFLGIADNIVPGFSIFGRYKYLYNLLQTFRMFMEIINSSANFFIYYRFNSKFRQTLWNSGKK